VSISAVVKGAAKYGIGLAALAYTVNKFWEPQGANPGIKGLLGQAPDAVMFAACVLLAMTATGLQYLRWYWLVRSLDLPFTGRNAARLGMVGTFYNTFLPGSIGGDAVKAFFIAKEQPGRRVAAVATVFADRMIGLFGLILYSAAVGGACWAMGDERIAANEYLRRIVTVCGLAVAGAAVGWVLLGFLPPGRAARFGHRLRSIPAVGRGLEEAWLAAWMYRERPGVIYKSIALSAVAHTAMVLLFHCGTRVFAPNPDALGTLSEHFVLAPIGLIAQALFPAPGGVGGAEYIFGYLYSLVGRDEATAVVGRLAVRVVEWGLGLAGFVAFLRMRAELPGGADEPAAEPEPALAGERGA
jgi:uncharacterized membrane protein YbhN (UPF0104 family)